MIGNYLLAAVVGISGIICMACGAYAWYRVLTYPPRTKR